ncbi:hypothetical protein ACTFIY_000109 [Dictyostelium cf. discoideum]
MNSLIEFQEKQLKIEKENEEKLKKEGYKPYIYGNGYTVLCKGDSPSVSVSSLVNPKNSFNFSDAKTANNNFTIDRHIKMKNPPDPFVFIKMPPSKVVWSTVNLKVDNNQTFKASCRVIPCAAFMRYLKSYPIVGTVETSLEKKKGFTQRFNVSLEVKASVSVGFFGCEASLEVTTGYEYEETVTSEVTQSWRQTLTEGTYIVYQNVLVYAYVLILTENMVEVLNRNNPGINCKYVAFETIVFFVPVNRDDPFTLRYQDAVYDPVEYDDLVSYLFKNTNTWFS